MAATYSAAESSSDNLSRLHRVDVNWRGRDRREERLFDPLINNLPCNSHSAAATLLSEFGCLRLLLPRDHIDIAAAAGSGVTIEEVRGKRTAKSTG